MDKKDVRIILGSETDIPNANVVLEVLKACNVTYEVSIASAHWGAGRAYVDFVDRINESIVAFIGGMSLAGPGIVSAMLRNIGRFPIVTGIPTDQPARSAIEDLPMGTPVATAGLNTVSLKHSLTNSALNLAHATYQITLREDIFKGIIAWYTRMHEEKRMQPTVNLSGDGLIPLPEKKK